MILKGKAFLALLFLYDLAYILHIANIEPIQRLDIGETYPLKIGRNIM